MTVALSDVFLIKLECKKLCSFYLLLSRMKGWELLSVVVFCRNQLTCQINPLYKFLFLNLNSTAVSSCLIVMFKLFSC